MEAGEETRNYPSIDEAWVHSSFAENVNSSPMRYRRLSLQTALGRSATTGGSLMGQESTRSFVEKRSLPFLLTFFHEYRSDEVFLEERIRFVIIIPNKGEIRKLVFNLKLRIEIFHSFKGKSIYFSLTRKQLEKYIQYTIAKFNKTQVCRSN